ncbi:hypothetical protein QQF64_034971 [Cirrhinus molitorella]|uniref:Uncharacterized protein n=1 Tax=Cirrhinus molitorella TaxID=172907 RepID=A0ABR3NF47_9TELE
MTEPHDSVSLPETPIRRDPHAKTHTHTSTSERLKAERETYFDVNEISAPHKLYNTRLPESCHPKRRIAGRDALRKLMRR